jgi:hypothetical protein
MINVRVEYDKWCLFIMERTLVSEWRWLIYELWSGG